MTVGSAASMHDAKKRLPYNTPKIRFRNSTLIGNVILLNAVRNPSNAVSSRQVDSCNTVPIDIAAISIHLRRYHRIPVPP